MDRVQGLTLFRLTLNYFKSVKEWKSVLSSSKQIVQFQRMVFNGHYFPAVGSSFVASFCKLSNFRKRYLTVVVFLSAVGISEVVRYAFLLLFDLFFNLKKKS